MGLVEEVKENKMLGFQSCRGKLKSLQILSSDLMLVAPCLQFSSIMLPYRLIYIYITTTNILEFYMQFYLLTALWQ